MEFLKIILIMTTTVALSIILTMRIIGEVEEKPPVDQHNNSIGSFTTIPKGSAMHEEKNPITLPPSKRLSRFLVEDNSPRRAADHCHKNNEKCQILRDNYDNKTLTCCNNKCRDLSTDRNNCGACKRKCDHTEDCCRGQCVTLAFDKRHCGRCNNRCPKGELCVYGMCNYP